MPKKQKVELFAMFLAYGSIDYIVDVLC